MRRFLVMAAVALLATPATAADLSAGPTTITAQMKKAGCGDTVTLIPAEYGTAAAPRLICPTDNRLEIRAEGSTFRTITIRAAEGVNWFGGIVSAPLGVDTPGVTIDSSRFIRVAGLTIQGHKVGITAVRGSDYEIVGNRMQGLRSDGINVTMAQRVLIEGNQVVDTRPRRAIYKKVAPYSLITDGDHADCAQIWTTANKAPTTEITIRNNYCRGEMQGIVSFDTVATGLDRIIIENNLLDGLEYWNGIVLYAARNSLIRNNVVLTKRGAVAQNNGAPIKTWIYLKAPVNTIACGNTVGALPKGEGTNPC